MNLCMLCGQCGRLLLGSPGTGGEDTVLGASPPKAGTSHGPSSKCCWSPSPTGRSPRPHALQEQAAQQTQSREHGDGKLPR